MQDLVLNLLPAIAGIVTAILAAWLSARWAVRRVYSEKLWEKQEIAYTDIINALYDLIEYSELKAKGYFYGRADKNSRLNKFEDHYDKAYWKIKRAADIGEFFISKEAVTALQDLRSRPKLKWEENPPWEIYEEDHKYYKEALEKVRQSAIKDLGSNKA